MTSSAPSALIIAPAWIGDAIMAEPLLARIREQQPEWRLDAFAPDWVAPVFSRMQGVGRVLKNPFGHGEIALRKRRALGRELAGTRYRRAYVLPNSLKSALIPFFARIPERVGFTGEGRLGLINVRHRLNKAALPRMVERFAQLAELPGAPLPRPVPEPRLVSTPKQQSAVLEKLALPKPERLAVFCPGAEYGTAKRWPATHFAALAEGFAARGFTVWLLGSGKDNPVGEAIEQQSGGACRNLCGRTGVEDAIDLIALADQVVCNDSGLMHVAAALRRPTVALFGSSSPEFTPPCSDQAKTLSLKLPCSPCFKRECPFGHLDCLAKLSPEQVMETALSGPFSERSVA